MTLMEYFNEFDKKYKDLEEISSNWYDKECGVVSYCSTAKCKDKNGNLSEEYIRARFVWSIINSGMYQKEYICVEFSLPKGNTKTTLKPDIVVFKNKEWKSDFEYAKENKDFSKIRQNILVVFESKKNSKTVLEAIENQLRSAMTENTSNDRIFGVYFDSQMEILIFKKIGNSELKRFYEIKELQQDGLHSWNIEKRDLLIELPSQKDFITNNESISNLQKLNLDSLDAIDETTFSDLMNVLKRANDRIKPKNEVRPLIVEFLTLKVFDEKRSKKNKDCLKFYILDNEKKDNGLAENSFRERIMSLYENAKSEYGNVLTKPLFSYSNNKGKLKPSDSNDEKFLIALVEIFQRRAILKAKNESFNQIIFNNFGDEKQKADKGQFFTPIPIVKNIIKILNPIKGEELCDPCCGICDFPAMAFKHAYRNESEFPDNASHFYGFDLESGNLKLAELNLVLNGDGGATLRSMDSLAQKLLENGDILKYGDFTSSNYDVEDWKPLEDDNKKLKQYDIIATNPPFGKGRDLSTGKNGKWDLSKDTLDLYETYYNKLDVDKKGNRKLPKSMDMGALFLENAYKLLKNGGRMGIVLSNSIASIKEWENVRKWFIDRMRIVAIIDLPPNTFGETGVATTVIIAYKPKIGAESLLDKDYEIFIKEINNIGYEVKTIKRSIVFKPIFRFDEDTLERTNILEEDFTNMQIEFTEFLKRQEEDIKIAFGLEGRKESE